MQYYVQQIGCSLLMQSLTLPDFLRFNIQYFIQTAPLCFVLFINQNFTYNFILLPDGSSGNDGICKTCLFFSSSYVISMHLFVISVCTHKSLSQSVSKHTALLVILALLYSSQMFVLSCVLCFIVHIQPLYHSWFFVHTALLWCIQNCNKTCYSYCLIICMQE